MSIALPKAYTDLSIIQIRFNGSQIFRFSVISLISSITMYIILLYPTKLKVKLNHLCFADDQRFRKTFSANSSQIISKLRLIEIITLKGQDMFTLVLTVGNTFSACYSHLIWVRKCVSLMYVDDIFTLLVIIISHNGQSDLKRC